MSARVQAAQTQPDAPTRAAITQLLATYEDAWDRADAGGLAASYTSDGDLMIPTGQLFAGPSAIGAFYGSVFARGFAGSHGAGEAQHVRMLSPEMAIADGTWSIVGIHDPKGKAQPDERGVFTAVIVRADGTWKLAALREQSSGTSVTEP
ncbi:MAG: SgcJ/EcaC family oxidoreductase [Candidatus Baltobacteraceae bacterium]